jgi:uncharacterized membrane protein YeaQ/YmgE (transglycosylase-associated protein family)
VEDTSLLTDADWAEINKLSRAFKSGEKAPRKAYRELPEHPSRWVVAGWLAGRVMEGGGFGLIRDLLVGLIGAFIGDWLLPQLGIHLGAGIVALIINAFIGAVVLLLILRLIGGWRYRGRWGRRW